MKKRLLLASAFISFLGATAQAQTPVVLNQKWDGPVEFMLQEQKQQAQGLENDKLSQTELKGFIISCSEVATVAEKIQDVGYQATIISSNILTAEIPVNYIPVVASWKEVNYINGARQFRPTMHSTRAVTGVDKIHSQEGLETPFTGKGVIVGVIDQGFEYKHAAFLDEQGNTRVRAVWNHQANQKPTERIPGTGDNMKGTHGHATHVTNIAAGSKVKGNNYYGIAPDAEIIMIPSTFQDDKVLAEAKYIADFAKKEGKPFVINMSFGSQIGPHDGTDNYSLGMNEISQAGGILVAAMGNEGGLKLHAHHEFTSDKEKVALIVTPERGQINPYFLLDLWEQTGDSINHLKMRPFTYEKSSRRKNFNDDRLNYAMKASRNLDPNNKKEHFYFEVNRNSLSSELCFGIEIEGNTGDEFHAWVNPSAGEILDGFGKGNLKGDNQYCVGEGAASIPHAIAVASFNGNDGNFTSAINGQVMNYGGRKGDISDFSSRGPSLGKEPKPMVAAPGHNVASAVSQYGGFDKNAYEIVSIINNGSKKYYYEVMSGTSMASPTVTGIVALWLEANPELTYEQVKYIIQETAKLDNFTGTKDKWNNERGFGKIDAYAGLKKALELAENTGINDQLNTETPITLQKEANQFRILFNNDESYANIALYNASGMEVSSKQLTEVRRGNETVVSTAGLPAGVYVVRITTTASTTAKKMLVK